MKYIDADKIKAEIERLRKENDNIKCESNKAYCQGYGDAFIDLLSSLGILEEPVSENLDEAACDHIRKVADAAGHPGWDWTTQDIIAAFKTGAEWMARQGAIKYWMAKDKDDSLLISNYKPYKRRSGYLDTDSFKWIDVSPALSRELFPDIKLEDSPVEVIVQIRKKEEK